MHVAVARLVSTLRMRTKERTITPPSTHLIWQTGGKVLLKLASLAFGKVHLKPVHELVVRFVLVTR